MTKFRNIFIAAAIIAIAAGCLAIVLMVPPAEPIIGMLTLSSVPV